MWGGRWYTRTMNDGLYAVTMVIDWEGPHEQYMYPTLAEALEAYKAKLSEYAAAKADVNAFIPDHVVLTGPYAWGENIVPDKVVRTFRAR